MTSSGSDPRAHSSMGSPCLSCGRPAGITDPRDCVGGSPCLSCGWPAGITDPRDLWTMSLNPRAWTLGTHRRSGFGRIWVPIYTYLPLFRAPKAWEAVLGSLRKPQKSKDQEILHRSYTQLFFSVPKKNEKKINIFFSKSKIWKILIKKFEFWKFWNFRNLRFFEEKIDFSDFEKKS